MSEGSEWYQIDPKLLEGKIPLAELRKESQLTLQRYRVSRAAALSRGLPSEPLAWEMLLRRVFWLQRVRQSLFRAVLLQEVAKNSKARNWFGR